MEQPPKQDGGLPGKTPSPPKLPPPKQNPVFRMMGLPNFRFRLPSRNWMIFLTVTGSFTAAVTYDRRQKKAVQQKWCDLVAHVAQQPIATNQMPRKLCVFLSAAPGDSIGPSRQYFKEYIKPVLVAAAMDYEVIEGRKEGDVRYGTAEYIRRLRRKRGEVGSVADEGEMDTDRAIDLIRQKMHVVPEPGLRGDLVLGRHTWKEYIRGLHEGWLGPLDEPTPPAESDPEPSPILPPTDAQSDDSVPTTNPEEDEKAAEEAKKPEEEQKEKKKQFPPPAYLPIAAYPSSPLSPHIPQILEPSAIIHQQHILGFLKTPVRTYQFLNKRHLADDIGRQTAAVVLASYRPYHQDESFASTGDGGELEAIPVATRAPESDAEVVQTNQMWEQQSLLTEEEGYWHKSVRKARKEGDLSELVWLGDVTLDSRIAQRMRRFELDFSEEERANRIASGAEKTRAIPTEDLRSRKVILGDVD